MISVFSGPTTYKGMEIAKIWNKYIKILLNALKNYIENI